MLKASSIGLIDILAQAMNYTGSAMSGPTLFSIIYSSVTVWAAVGSRIILRRKMGGSQWCAIIVVFGGLSLTAFDSVSLGGAVLQGSVLLLVGSALHSTTYVLSEAVMTRGVHSQRLAPRLNCLLQGTVGAAAFLAWQFFYTLPRLEDKILLPMRRAGTSTVEATMILMAIMLANLVHSIAFQFTLKHFPGGATSAGVFKGLQAVLVFVVTSAVFCGRTGGSEMCFSLLKFASLLFTASGVAMYGKATQRRMRLDEMARATTIDHAYSKVPLSDG